MLSVIWCFIFKWFGLTYLSSQPLVLIYEMTVWCIYLLHIFFNTPCLYLLQFWCSEKIRRIDLNFILALQLLCMLKKGTKIQCLTHGWFQFSSIHLSSTSMSKSFIRSFMGTEKVFCVFAEIEDIKTDIFFRFFFFFFLEFLSFSDLSPLSSLSCVAQPLCSYHLPSFTIYYNSPLATSGLLSENGVFFAQKSSFTHWGVISHNSVGSWQNKTLPVNVQLAFFPTLSSCYHY